MSGEHASAPLALPAHLAERLRPADAARAPVAGELVLYWMHHAARGHENPALDVARHAAAELSLPLLVYQGLGAGHRYDSDRHHAFILEGARDAAAELAGLGVRHAFHLGEGAPGAAPLHALARRAALVVTEDLPAPPFPRWTARLSARAGTPMWRVDTACIVPMAKVGRAFDRAFAFRRAVAKEHEARIARPWPEPGEACAVFEGELGFEPLDLERLDVAEACARAPIDHGIAPAPGTVGGSRAGYARWRAFADGGLARYARDRNDAAVAPPRGVSRLSPYLHHGQVSPFRIAREAAAAASDGARKFLDELLVWRELAHNFCFHHEDALEDDFYGLLPAWARETLEATASRASVPIGRLEGAASGEPLWDLAQRSLLVHGELHNNVRMTWGKALLGWSSDAREALARMVDLNHRYALDGSDPNSYAGLGYALGLFDRPFPPGDGTFGQVRARSVAGHAKRLDLPAYARRVSRPARARRETLVIGAGVSGLAAARALGDADIPVVVLDRGRRAGGRLATRRAGEARFDHGCVAFEARDPRVQRHVEAWREAGVVAPWTPLVGDPRGSDRARWERLVGVPGASALAEHLAESLEVRTEAGVARVERAGDRWTAFDGEGRALTESDGLILAMPPEQAQRLLEPADALAAQLAQVRSRPCWAAMVSLATPAPTELDVVLPAHPAIAQAVRESSKPGRPAGEHWTLHARPEWSEERLDAERDAVASELLTALGEVLGFQAEASSCIAHRWGLARASAAVAGEAHWDGGRRLAVCGDWCAGGDVAGAVLSGRAAAGRIAASARLAL